jgi:hypothetical protein
MSMPNMTLARGLLDALHHEVRNSARKRRVNRARRGWDEESGRQSRSEQNGDVEDDVRAVVEDHGVAVHHSPAVSPRQRDELAFDRNWKRLEPFLPSGWKLAEPRKDVTDRYWASLTRYCGRGYTPSPWYDPE